MLAKPDLTFHETIRGSGVLRVGGASLNVTIVTLERSKTDFRASWQLSAVTEDHGPMASLSFFTAPIGEPIRFLGRTERGDELRIPKVALGRASGREIHAQVSEFELGPEELSFHPNHQNIIVYITPTPIALRRSYVERVGSAEIALGREPLQCSLSTVRLQLEERTRIERVDVAHREVAIEVPYVVMAGEVDRARVTRRPLDLVRALEPELLRFLKVVGLLSRGFVGHHRIEVYSQYRDESTLLESTSTVARTTAFSPIPDYLEPFVKPYSLPTTSLDLMYARLMTCPRPDQLAVAVSFLSNSHTASFIEENVSNIFIAIEAIVGALPQPADLEAPAIRALLQSLREHLQHLREQNPSFCSDAVARVERKLEGLPHRAIAERLIGLIESYLVPWSDLWPPETSLRDAIRQAYDLRNDLAHRGVVPNIRRAYPEVIRLHMLAERLLYAALGGEGDWLDDRAYNHVEFVRRELWPLPSNENSV